MSTSTSIHTYLYTALHTSASSVYRYMGVYTSGILLCLHVQTPLVVSTPLHTTHSILGCCAVLWYLYLWLYPTPCHGTSVLGTAYTHTYTYTLLVVVVVCGCIVVYTYSTAAGHTVHA
jgi:hypothetical protein